MRRRALLAAALALPGCASIVRLPAPPAEAALREDALGIRHARLWFDGPAAPVRALVAESRARGLAARRGAPGTPRHFLALSGGGDSGAFGAGLMQGWTERGDRPEFDTVTGISAGALIAPFAFLGPDYDPALREVFTEQQPFDLILMRGLVRTLLFNQALADTSPLYRLIERHADEAMLAAIAREYARGRLLLVGTVNLDLQRPSIWNMGAIAASGHPQALRLFRRILLASASIPGAFPPVLLDAEVDGRRFQEMHVDGGAAVAVFLNPPGAELHPGERGRTVWVVRNGKMDQQAPENIPRGLFTITARSAQTLLHFAGIGDINRIYLAALRDGITFRLARVAPGFDAPRREPFDPVFMRALFQHGREAGREAVWLTRPPTVGE